MIRRILVALDDSHRARGVIAAAAEIAGRFDAVLVPLRAIEIPPEFPPAAHVGHGDPLVKHLDNVAREELGELVGSTTVRREPAVVVHGEASRAILRAAEEHDVDLIVLGSHGYSGLDRILGTTAARVVNLSCRSVLVVHERKPGPGGSSRGDDLDES